MVLMSLPEFLGHSLQHTGGKHYTSQNVLVVVNFDLKFTYVLASWEGQRMMLTFSVIA